LKFFPVLCDNPAVRYSCVIYLDESRVCRKIHYFAAGAEIFLNPLLKIGSGCYILAWWESVNYPQQPGAMFPAAAQADPAGRFPASRSHTIFPRIMYQNGTNALLKSKGVVCPTDK